MERRSTREWCKVWPGVSTLGVIGLTSMLAIGCAQEAPKPSDTERIVVCDAEGADQGRIVSMKKADYVPNTGYDTNLERCIPPNWVPAPSSEPAPAPFHR